MFLTVRGAALRECNILFKGKECGTKPPDVEISHSERHAKLDLDGL